MVGLQHCRNPTWDIVSPLSSHRFRYIGLLVAVSCCSLLHLIGGSHDVRLDGVDTNREIGLQNEDARSRRCSSSSSSSACPTMKMKESMLLQRADLRSRVSVDFEASALSKDTIFPARAAAPAVQASVSASGHLSLCHPSLVTRACRLLSESDHGTSLTQDSVKGHLSANESFLPLLWKELGFSIDTKSIQCQELCAALVAYVEKLGGTLPPASDLGCYMNVGEVVCDVDLTPGRLVKSMAETPETLQVDDGPQVSGPIDDPGAEQLRVGTPAIREDGKSEAQLMEARPHLVAGQQRGLRSQAPRLLAVRVAASPGQPLERQPRRGQMGNNGSTTTTTTYSSSSSYSNSNNSYGNSTSSDTPSCLHYNVRQAVEQLAALFRFFPLWGQLSITTPPLAGNESSNSSELRNDTLSSASDVAANATVPIYIDEAEELEAREAIAESEALARAWVSTVITEMNAWATAQFRSLWFGGEGDIDETAVRLRILRTMNFVSREFGDGINYVYPGDNATGTACGNNIVAYVWKYEAPVGEEGYWETTGPVCDRGQAFDERCGVDGDGRYFIYLCRRWLELSNSNTRVATLVHESVHHAGPTDISYDTDQMQGLSQDAQLNNAANYHNFAQDVAQATWGCADADPPSGYPFDLFTCSGVCTCPAFLSYCYHDTYGAAIRVQCAGTCGTCSDPVGDGETTTILRDTMPATSSTSPPTTAFPVSTTPVASSTTATLTNAPQVSSTTLSPTTSPLTMSTTAHPTLSPSTSETAPPTTSVPVSSTSASPSTTSVSEVLQSTTKLPVEASTTQAAISPTTSSTTITRATTTTKSMSSTTRRTTSTITSATTTTSMTRATTTTTTTTTIHTISTVPTTAASSTTSSPTTTAAPGIETTTPAACLDDEGFSDPIFKFGCQKWRVLGCKKWLPRRLQVVKMHCRLTCDADCV
mmetsp:Transcript_8642/g.18842  ORF Transcript_8642/g.18842 Transcript_8642/m.18842 type:complete len:935 (-) Transcript_8642:369-3173(-)